MPNGDIVSGCSDAVVRVFSCSEDRWLPEADLKAFDDEVANQALPAQQVGDVKASDLPDLEALAVPGECIVCSAPGESPMSYALGKKSGETKMIKNEGAVEAHQVRMVAVVGISP
jgi:phospholipase A-2-activating protein